MSKIVKKIIPVLIALLVGIGGTVGVTTITTTKDEDGNTKTVIQTNFQVELSETTIPAVIETADGEITVENVPTVENIDADNITGCSEDEECGLGKYIYAPTTTAWDFRNYTFGHCWNTDDFAGAQCWDLGDLFWQNYTPRRLSTCGTGAAKGIWNCKEYNAGDEFELIYDVTKVQLGDWLIFGNGTYGHVGMAMGGYNNGYVALLGQNQGGYACEGGGSSTNIINISTKSFLGAFRPKTYIKPEPQPEPTPTPESCDRIEVKAGDTLGEIMKRCEGKVSWGEAMNEYARSWKSVKLKLYPTVYDGWVSPNGVGLFAGDVIERK